MHRRMLIFRVVTVTVSFVVGTCENIDHLFQLHIAAANGYIQVMEFLLSHGVSVDPVDGDSWQPVHCATCWGQVSRFVTILDAPVIS